MMLILENRIYNEKKQSKNGRLVYENIENRRIRKRNR